MIPVHIKRELLNMQDQIAMAEASNDEGRIDAVERACNARLDEIEAELGAVNKDSGATFTSRLGAFRYRGA